MNEAAPGRGRLAAPLARGLAWQSVSKGAAVAARVVTVVLVARQLGPRESGLAAMAGGVAVFGGVFADGAMGSALVQRRDAGGAERATVLWLSLAAGVLVTLVGVAVAGPVADLYGEPRVRGLLMALSSVFTLSALATLPAALLERRMDFRHTELAALVATLASAAAAVVLAYAGAGAWAIVAQALVAAATSTLLLWAFARPRIGGGFSREAARSLGAFGGRVLGSRLCFCIQRSADNVLVGGVLGAAPLGAYALAYNTMMEPFSLLVDPVRSVLYPAMAAVQDDLARVRGLWLRGTRGLVAVIAPLLLGVAVAAPELVETLLGRRWEAAAAPMRVLTVVGAAQSVIVLNSVVLMALGRTRELLRFAALAGAASVAGFAAGLPFGIVGVAAGYAAASLVILPAYVRVAARAVGARPALLVSELGGVAQAAAITVAGMIAIREVLLLMHAGAPGRLAGVLACGLPIAAAATAWRAPAVRRDLRVLRDARRTLQTVRF